MENARCPLRSRPGPSFGHARPASARLRDRTLYREDLMNLRESLTGFHGLCRMPIGSRFPELGLAAFRYGRQKRHIRGR